MPSIHHVYGKKIAKLELGSNLAHKNRIKQGLVTFLILVMKSSKKRVVDIIQDKTPAVWKLMKLKVGWTVKYIFN